MLQYLAPIDSLVSTAGENLPREPGKQAHTPRQGGGGGGHESARIQIEGRFLVTRFYGECVAPAAPQPRGPGAGGGGAARKNAAAPSLRVYPPRAVTAAETPPPPSASRRISRARLPRLFILYQSSSEVARPVALPHHYY